MIEVILYGCLCFATGWWAHSHVNNNYKERWKTATALLEETPEMREHKLLEQRAQKEEQKKIDAATHNHQTYLQEQEIKLLLNMTPEDRAKIEKERMFHGYEPIDPLTALPSNIIVKMKKERYFHGYDS